MTRTFALFACLVCAGCQGDRELRPHGTATFNAQPIPLGMILFLPDPATNPKGKPGSAEIRNGRFQCPPGKGISPGDYNLHITAGDGVGAEPFRPLGKPFFEEKVLKFTVVSDADPLALTL